MSDTMQDDFADADVQTAVKVKVKRPKRYAVVFHNDDFTPMDFVVFVLGKYFHKNHDESVAIMLTVHNEGRAIVGLYTREVAEEKVHQTMEHAKINNYPLHATSEEHTE